MPWSRFNPKKTISRSVLRPGIAGQTCAGRQLTVADFTDMGLSTPVGLFNLGSTTNLGSGGNLTNKGTVAFTATGVEGTANTAAQFTGSTSQALHVNDTGASDPFRIRTGSWGCWFRTARTGGQVLLGKRAASGNYAYLLYVNSSNVVNSWISTTGSNTLGILATSTVTDNNFHFAVATYDGNLGKLYVDGNQEATTLVNGTLFPAAAPFVIGAEPTDALSNPTVANPHYGSIDEAFVTADVLSEDQIRNLYAAKVSYTLPNAPKSFSLSVNRYRKGAALSTSDFTATPLHLYNFTGGALTDAGSLNTTLTNNNSSVSVAGADGLTGGSFQFDFLYQGPQSLTATDTGLPSGTSSMSMGCWVKISDASATVHPVITYGSSGTALMIFAQSGIYQMYQAGPVGGSGTGFTGNTGNHCDGSWRFVVLTQSSSASDGYGRKLYIDGKFNSFGTTVASITLGGANSFRLGSRIDASGFMSGSVGSAFVTNYEMSALEINQLYAKGSQALGVSPKTAGDHIEKATSSSLLFIGDTLDSQNTIDIDLRP